MTESTKGIIPLPWDVLNNLTDTFDIYMGAVWGISLAGILPLAFCAALLTNQAKIISGEKPNFSSTIHSLVWIVFAMFFYRFLFRKILAFCEGIAACIITPEQWVTIIHALTTVKTETGVFNLLSITLLNAILHIFVIIAVTIEEIFNIVRFIFLGILYVVGPICLAAAVYQPTRKLFNGWLLSTFQVAFWIVILRIMQAALISFQVHSLVKVEDPASTMVISAVMLLMFISAPAFTSKLLSGHSIGLLGSMIIGGATYLVSLVHPIGRVRNVLEDSAAGASAAIQTYKNLAKNEQITKMERIKAALTAGINTALGRKPSVQPEKKEERKR